MPIRCGDCGRDLGELPPEQACPQCGSPKRNHVVEVQGLAMSMSGGQATLTVTEYPDVLLGIAQGLIPVNPGIAIVVAHMAAEVATERTLSRAFASRGLSELEEPMLSFWSGYSLANDRHRKLYVSLTGDRVHEQSFWQDFFESARARNQIMHGGRIGTTAEAERSLTAVTAFVAHVTRICP